MIKSLQVTIGSTATQVTTVRTPVRQFHIQNNSAHACRIGDATVSTTTPAAANGGTAGKGLLVAPGSPGGAVTVGTLVASDTGAQEWFVAGTQGDVIDFLCVV